MPKFGSVNIPPVRFAVSRISIATMVVDAVLLDRQGSQIMVSPNSSEQSTQTDALEDAIRALRVIYNGASVSGRWICDRYGEAVGHDANAPDKSHYDRNNPPIGYNAAGWISAVDKGPVPPDHLIPADWEPYTAQEQLSWLSTCAKIAKDTLEKLGLNAHHAAE